MKNQSVKNLPFIQGITMGGATGMATISMARALLGELWPLMALAITLFALCTVYVNLAICVFVSLVR